MGVIMGGQLYSVERGPTYDFPWELLDADYALSAPEMLGAVILWGVDLANLNSHKDAARKLMYHLLIQPAKTARLRMRFGGATIGVIPVIIQHMEFAGSQPTSSTNLFTSLPKS